MLGLKPCPKSQCLLWLRLGHPPRLSIISFPDTAHTEGPAWMLLDPDTSRATSPPHSSLDLPTPAP